MDSITRERLQQSIGAQRVRQGFARDADHDIAWACGFPNMIWRSDAPAKMGARTWWEKNQAPMPAGPWPVEVIYMRVRSILREDELPSGEGRKARVAARKAIEDECATMGPPTEAEALEVAGRIIRDDLSAGFGLGQLLWGIEALVGADAVVDRVLTTLEAMTDEVLSGDNHESNAGVLHYVRPMLWRLTPDAHASAQARLASLWERASTAQGSSGPRYERRPRLLSTRVVAAVLDEMVNGVEAVVANHIRNPWMAALCDDGPFLTGWFAGLQGGSDVDVAPGAAFVARDAVLVHYVQCWEEYKAKEKQQILVAALATIDDPRVTEWMFTMTMSSKAKTDAKKWFVEHRETTADFVRSKLDSRYKAGATKLAKAMKL